MCFCSETIKKPARSAQSYIMGNNSDFLSTDYFSLARSFVPNTRDEYLQQLQKVYNLKLHTPFPLVVQLEPTNICNHRCRMCCWPDMNRKHSYVSDYIVDKVIAECVDNHVWCLQFFFFGEPFLHKKTIKYIKKAKKLGVKNVSITTNFSTISNDDISRLFNSDIDSIHISFHGLNAEKYEKIHGRNDYAKVKKNIETILSLKERYQVDSPWISLTYVRTTESNAEISEYKAYWQDKVNNIHISPQFEYRNGSINGQPRSVIAQILPSNDGSILYRNNQGRVPCRQLWTRMAVLANGELVPCSQNIDGDLALGNIADMTIGEAWTGEKMAQLRMAHISNNLHNFPVCQVCTDWDWSGRVDGRPKITKGG